MIRYLLLLCLSFPVWADPVNMDLQKIKLPELVAFVYGQVLDKSYVVDSALLADESLVSINFKKFTPEQIDKETRRLLDVHGYSLDSKGTLHIVKREKGEEEFTDSVMVYRPLNRPVSYLLDLATTLFKPGAFTSSRKSGGVNLSQVTGSAPAASAAHVPPSGSGKDAPPVNVAEQGINGTLDRDVDVLIFHGKPAEVERLKGLLSQLDVSAGEVMVKAVVYEVQTDKKDGSAVDLLASILGGKFGLNLSGGAAASSNVFMKLPYSNLNLSAVYSAVNSDDRFKVLTSPRLRVKSGASARIEVGDKTPVLGGISMDGNGRSTQSVSYMQSGVIFDIAPVVREAGTEVKVSQQVSNFVPTTTGVNGSPTLNQRQLSTSITAHDDEVILIGGLDNDRHSENQGGLSFLPKWARSKGSEDQHSEIVLMLTVQRI